MTSPSPDGRNTVDSQALVAHLASYARCIEARDATAAAALWDVPALILGDSHAHGPLSISRLTELLETAVQGSGEAASTTPGSTAPLPAPTPLEDSIERIQWLSDRVATIDTGWPQRSYGGLLEGVSGTCFIVRIDERGHPKIRGLLLRNRPPTAARSSEE
jgi:hypothetical protein